MNSVPFSMSNALSPVLVMGVSGSGKSTLARELANALGGFFLDADDFHPPANIRKMRSGIPLNDEDRAGWLGMLNEVLLRQIDSGRRPVLACSALKERYRQQLFEGMDSYQIVFLDISKELLLQRMRTRQNHFMPVSLLDSQLETLEAPKGNSVIRVEGSMEIPELLQAIVPQLCAG